MPEGTVLTAITTIVGTLAAVIAVLWKKSETRWELAVADLKALHSESLQVLQANHDRMAKQYEVQLQIALTDSRDFKEMLRQAIRSGNTAVEVGVEQARRLPSGGGR